MKIYLDRIRAQSKEPGKVSGDYALSKVLGITQSRVSSLKERKELKYPSEFDWKEAFRKVVSKAEYIDGKVEIYIDDHRLYTELEQIVRDLGSYSETKLTKRLLVVKPPVFIDLMMECEGKQEEQMREKLCEILQNNSIDASEYFERKVTFKEALKNVATENGVQVILDVVKEMSVWGFAAGSALEMLLSAMKKAETKEKKGWF